MRWLRVSYVYECRGFDEREGWKANEKNEIHEVKWLDECLIYVFIWYGSYRSKRKRDVFPLHLLFLCRSVTAKKSKVFPGRSSGTSLQVCTFGTDAHSCKLGSASNRFSILVGGDCLQLTPSFCQPTADCGCTANILFVAGCWGSAKANPLPFLAVPCV